MRIFAYEMATAGGLASPAGAQSCGSNAVPASIIREGRAMIEALVSDLAAVPGNSVEMLWDAALDPPRVPASVRWTTVHSPEQERDAFCHAARRAEGVVVIAPETGGSLAERCRLVTQSGGRLLGPDVELVELATDKHATAERLFTAGVPVPDGTAMAAGERLAIGFRYPAVLKPRDGAGSQQVELIADADAARRRGAVDFSARLEPYVPGIAASIAVLCGPDVRISLPPCLQRLSDDGRFVYLGGSTTADASLRARADRLAYAVVTTLPSPRGYLGIDFVFGEDPSGSDDCVIEINPRLTTSYIGLRRAVRENLAQAWLEGLAGRCPTLSFRNEEVEFDAEGRITRHAPASR